MKARTLRTGRLHFVSEAIKGEFADEARKAGVATTPLGEGIYFSADLRRLCWVEDSWPVSELEFTSIADATKKLRQLHRHWRYVGGLFFRRGQLIADGLKAPGAKAVTFGPGAGPGESPWCFTLASQDKIYYSEQPLKQRYPGGKIRFVEDRSGPPSRAYLKLWEVITLFDLEISPRDHVIDLGATPGGWSYVAASLGAQVTMIDRSRPAMDQLGKFSKLSFVSGDGLNPPQQLLREATVILSDMACEPRKLIESISTWLKLPKVRLMVCTLKVHGMSDKELMNRFAEIENSELVHLHHNGHELTWIWRA